MVTGFIMEANECNYNIWMATQTVNVKNLKKLASLEMMEAHPECPSGSEHFPGDQVKSAFLLNCL